MRVLISGAGIAGLTAAYWLRRFGHSPSLVEQADSLVVGGYKIDVRGAALDVLRRMGIEDEVRIAATHMRRATLVNQDGAVIGEMTGDDFGHRSAEDLEIVRGTLCTLLRAQLPDVDLVFDDTIRAIEQSADGVSVTFASGRHRDFDIVIGADGLHSNVRSIAFGSEDDYRRDLGMYLCVYSVPNYLGLDREEIQYSEIGRIAAVWATRDDQNAKATFGFAGKPGSISLHDPTEQRNAVRAAYAGIGWEVPRLLDLMPSASDWYFDTAAQIDLESYSSGRVTLVGDAAYCASPMSGQGSSLALVGAYVLAGELASAEDHSVAFASYESIMRPFVQANQELAIESSRLMTAVIEQGEAVLSGSEVEATIARATERITAAANSITLGNYLAPDHD